MKFLVVLLAVVAAAHCVSFTDLIREEWAQFKLEHSKEYESETEEKFRMKVFMENRHKIAKHNQKYEIGKVPYKLGINKYTDMLHHEFVNTFNGFNKTAPKNLQGVKKHVGATFISPANVQIPESVDWRKQGAVTPVKNQGQCGSCWSFSSTGALEGQHFRKTNVLVSLSEQNLVDCSSQYGNNGCNGGLMDNAFQYVKDNGGIDTENSYPYEADDDKCRYNPKNSGATDAGYVDVESGNEKKLQEALATIGPVSIAIDASQETFQFYKSGVYSDPECSSQNLDHGVLAVGYGTDEDGKDYWIVKNSWGTTWGDEGYIHIARNQHNMCGVATQASYPLV